MLSLNLEKQEEPCAGCRTHCIDCAAVRGGVLARLIGDGVDDCQFATYTIDARKALPDEPLGPGSLVLVRRGVIIRQRLDPGRRPVAVDAIGPGGAFFVTAGSQAAYAVDRTLICSCDEGVLLRGLKASNHGLSDLHALHAQSSYRMERLAEARGRQSVRARVAALLSVLADTLSPHGGPRAQLPSGLLQRDLASLVSTRHESVCRILRDLSQEGIVEHGPDGIRILDRSRLAQI